MHSEEEEELCVPPSGVPPPAANYAAPRLDRAVEMDDAAGCCAAPEAQGFAAEAEACDALACDPTLEACCQRDLQQQAMVARLKARLSIHDRSKERQRVAGQVVGTAPPAAAPAPDSGSELGTEDEEEEGEVGEWKVQRALGGRPIHARTAGRSLTSTG
jgi:hypothetical protein